MSIYVPPALNAVDFAVTSFTPANLTPAENALSVYTPPSLSAVDFALTAYTQPTYPDVGWELDSGGGDITLPLSGVGSTGSAGSMSASFSLSLSGLFATGSVGSVAPAHSIPLSGVSGGSFTGTVVPGISVGLSGTQATSTVGTLSPASSVSITGIAASTATGSVTPPGPSGVALTGVEVFAEVGSVSVLVESPQVVESSRISFAPKAAEEYANYFFSFENVLSAGETIVAARTVSQFWSGDESFAEPVVNGPAVVQGTEVQQQFFGGVAGTVYIVTCSVLTSLSNVRRLSAYLVIV